MNTYALIVAAGTGSRFGDDLPKQYQNLSGKPVLWHSINTFSKVVPTQNIVIAIHETHETMFQNSVLCDFSDSQYIFGNETRNKSVFNGLKFISNNLNTDKNTQIMIHDAARPLISEDHVRVMLEKLNSGQKACSFATKSVDTMCYADKDQMISKYIPREDLFAIQTPQGFHFDMLMTCHENTQGDGFDDFTDDTSLVRHYGIDVELIENISPNVKITTQQDLELIRKIFTA